MTEYTVYLYDPLGTELAVIDNFSRLDYARKENDIGALDMTLPDIYPLSVFKVDGRIAVFRTTDDGKTTLDGETIWFIRRITRNFTSDGLYQIEILAEDAISLLKRRVIAYEAGTDRSQKPSLGGHVAVDDILKEIVRENMGTDATDPPRYSNGDWETSGLISIQGYKDLMTSVQVYKTFAWRNLFDTLKEFADTVNQVGYEDSDPSKYLAFDIVALTITDLEFRTYVSQRGQDKTYLTGASAVVLSPELGNLGEARWDDDHSQEITYVLIGGPGQKEERLVGAKGDLTRMGSSPYGDIEYFVDARNVDPDSADVNLQLDDEGRWALMENRPKKIFTARLLETPSTRYGIHFGFGDRVTAQFGEETFNCRVSSIHVTLEGGQESIDVGLRSESYTTLAVINVVPDDYSELVYSLSVSNTRNIIHKVVSYPTYITTIDKWCAYAVAGLSIANSIYDLLNNSGYKVGGAFTSAGSVVANHVAYWTGAVWASTTGAESVLGIDGPVYALTTHPTPGFSGWLLVGGDFSNADPAACNSIASNAGTDGSSNAWHAVGLGTNATGAVYTFYKTSAPSLKVYIGGAFTTLNLVANTNHIGYLDLVAAAQFDGTYRAMGTGVSGLGNVYNITGDGLTTIFACGDFTEMGGVLLTNKIARWVSPNWNSMYAVDPFDANEYPVKMYYDASVPCLYVLTADTTNLTIKIRKWEAIGDTWSVIKNDGDTLTVAQLAFPWSGTIGEGADGYMWYGSSDTRCEGLKVRSGAMVKFDGTNWVYTDLILGNDGASDTHASDLALYDFGANHDYTVSYYGSSAPSFHIQPGRTTVNNDSGASTYPTFQFKGPGYLIYLENYTTGTKMYFQTAVTNMGIPVNIGETLVLTFNGLLTTFVSSIHGDISADILAGSDTATFDLQAGNNILKVLILDYTVGQTLAMVTW